MEESADNTPRESGVTLQSWLWSPPVKHSTRQIEDLLERIAMLYELGIHRHFADLPDDLLRRYARRLANRPPSIGARIKEPLRTIESAYFLRYCLLIGTDRAVRPGSDWIINGQKVWTSDAHLSDWGLLLARSNPAAQAQGSHRLRGGHACARSHREAAASNAHLR